MKYEEAKRLIEQHQNDLGKINNKGFKITRIIIVPQNSIDRDQFLKAFLYNGNANSTILPYRNKEVEVWAIDEEHLKNAGVLFFDVIGR